MEHRWGQRRRVHQSVHLRTVSGLAAAGHIIDISISGAFVKTSLPVAPLSVVVVSVIIEKGRSRPLPVVEAQVVRRLPEGMALEWCEFNPEFARVISEIPTRIERFEETAVAFEFLS